MTTLRERGAPRPLPADAWRPPASPVPARPLAEWNPIAARYVAQLYAHVKAAYGPAADAGLPEFFVEDGGPGVLLVVQVSGPVHAVVLGTGARPGPLAFAEGGGRATDQAGAAYRKQRLVAELRAATGFRPPVPQEPAYP